MSLHHFATRSDTGPVVAYLRPDTRTAVVLLECLTLERAEVEAARLNAEGAKDAQALRAWIRAPRECRRRARFFPSECASNEGG